jgi:hypothetical protein
MNLLQRPALGQTVPIGTLYNARDDSFLPDNLLGDQLPSDAIQSAALLQSNSLIGHDDSYKAKFDVFGITPALAASILAGMLDYKGSACSLDEPRTQNTVWGALYHSIHTGTDRLNPTCPGIRDGLGKDAAHNPAGTHVVVGID